MIQSNLEFTVSVWAFFSLCRDEQNSLRTAAYGLGVVFLVVYPMGLSAFLITKQRKLTTPEYQKRYDSVYDGLDTDSKTALLYYPVFSMRRFYIVLINLVFNAECPWTNFQETRYLYKILSF